MPELTEEQLKQMSPEELRELQKKQCIFCQIVSGKVSSKKVFEDKNCIGILDINPANPGHVLIIPKEHYSIMQLMPKEIVEHLFSVAKKISRAQLTCLKVDGTNIFVANGAAAGQKSPHFMIHLIPRKESDGITCFDLPKNQITEVDQEKLRVAIRLKVNEQFGIKEELPQFIRKQPEMVSPELVREEKSKEENEDSSMFNIPPPEYFEEQDNKKEINKTEKKHFDLDAISSIFK
jgi:histidine triad (HIT) family protein